jgi:hypothetical protein
MPQPQAIEAAFSSQPELHQSIKEALRTLVLHPSLLTRCLADLDHVEATPQHTPLFTSIAHFILSLPPPADDHAPASKRRRVDIAPSTSNGNGTTTVTSNGTSNARVESAPSILDLPDPLSFLLPSRKKLALLVTEAGVAAKHPISGAIEASVRWSDIGT